MVLYNNGNRVQIFVNFIIFPFLEQLYGVLYIVNFDCEVYI